MSSAPRTALESIPDPGDAGIRTVVVVDRGDGQREIPGSEAERAEPWNGPDPAPGDPATMTEVRDCSATVISGLPAIARVLWEQPVTGEERAATEHVRLRTGDIGYRDDDGV